jgi:hypothetical protein
MASSTSEQGRPLEEIEQDSNFHLIDVHQNKKGNDVLTFEDKRSGDMKTYPNVSHTAMNESFVDTSVTFTDETKQVIKEQKERAEGEEIANDLAEMTYNK